jgi:hypothetical protein
MLPRHRGLADYIPSKSAMQEFADDRLFDEAVEIAKKVLSGDIDPNKGCTLIGDINHSLDWPEELAAFGLLAHTQHEHDNLGITAEACVPEIIDECKRLIALAEKE